MKCAITVITSITFTANLFYFVETVVIIRMRFEIIFCFRLFFCPLHFVILSLHTNYTESSRVKLSQFKSCTKNWAILNRTYFEYFVHALAENLQMLSFEDSFIGLR